MDPRAQHIRRQFMESLSTLIDHGVDSLDESTVATILREVATEIDPSCVGRRASFSEEDGRHLLSITYTTAMALEREIDAFIKARGLMIDVEPAPPLMEEIDVVIEGQGLDSNVQLRGRAVHRSNDGVAVELMEIDDEKAKQLKNLPQQMRDAPPQEPARLKGPAAEISEVQTVDEISTASPLGEEPSSSDDSEHESCVVDQLIDRPEQIKKRWDPRRANIDEMLMEVATVDGYGVLEFLGDQCTRQYIIHHGKLIGVRSQPPVDAEKLLVAKLIAMGFVDDEDVERAGVLASIHDIGVPDALVDMGCVTVEQLLTCIKARLVDEFDGIYERDAHEARLYLLENRPPLRLRRSAVCIVAQLAQRVRERYAKASRQQREEYEKRFADCRVLRAPDLAVEIDRLGMSSEEQRFVEVILDEPRSLSELRRVSNLRFEQTLSMLLMLDELGLLERINASRRLPEHDEIKGLSHRINADNHFEVLGVHWSAHDNEVEHAYRQIQQKLDVPDRVEEEMADTIAQLRRRVSEAYAVLSKRKSRREYRKQTVDSFSLKNGLNIYENKVSSLSMRNDKSELLDVLRRIVELKPGARKRRRELEAVERLIEESNH